MRIEKIGTVFFTLIFTSTIVWANFDHDVFFSSIKDNFSRKTMEMIPKDIFLPVMSVVVALIVLFIFIGVAKKFTKIESSEKESGTFDNSPYLGEGEKYNEDDYLKRVDIDKEIDEYIENIK